MIPQQGNGSYGLSKGFRAVGILCQEVGALLKEAASGAFFELVFLIKSCKCASNFIRISFNECYLTFVPWIPSWLLALALGCLAAIGWCQVLSQFWAHKWGRWSLWVFTGWNPGAERCTTSWWKTNLSIAQTTCERKRDSRFCTAYWLQNHRNAMKCVYIFLANAWPISYLCKCCVSYPVIIHCLLFS